MGYAPKGNGHPATDGDENGILFFLEETSEGDGGATPNSRLAAARAALRDAQQAEWEERQRVARAGVEGLTPAHAALLAARQAQAQAAEAAVTELRRRAASLRHALALAEQAVAAQRSVADRLRRELAELGE
jgi:hypothetical protein